MYSGVPNTIPASVSVAPASTARASPKSQDLGDLVGALLHQEYVVGLEVAMDDPLLVGVGQRPPELAADVGDPSRRHRPAETRG